MSKEILIKTNIKSTKELGYTNIYHFHTNDNNSAEIIFQIEDMSETELAQSQAILYLHMNDGSFFKKPFGTGNVSRIGNQFRYVLKENELLHSGVAETQIEVHIAEKKYSSHLYKFKIVMGLETKSEYEVEIKNLDTETKKEIRELKATWQALINEINEKEFSSSPEIVEARSGEISLNARLGKMVQATATAMAEITAARNGETSLKKKIDNIQQKANNTAAEILQANDGKSNLKERLDEIQQIASDASGSNAAGESVNVKDFGAVGDGITDDTNAIFAAINSLEDVRNLEFEGNKTYLISQTIRITKDNTHIIGNGARILANCPTGATILNISKGEPFKTISGQSASMEMSGTIINNVSDTTGISPGDMVRAENVDGNPNYSNGHLGIVISVTENTITTSITAPRAMPVLTHIYVYKPLKNVIVEDLEIINQDEHGFGIIGQKLLNCKIENVHVKPLGRTAIQLEGINCLVRRCITEGFKDNTISEGAGGRVGYGINLYGHNMVGEYNLIMDSKHCLTSAHRRIFSTNIIFRNNIVYGTNKGPRAPLDFHGNSSGKFEGNIVHNVRNQGASIRDNNSQCIGNVFFAAEDYKEYRKGIYITDSCRKNVILSKNEFYGYFDDAIAIEAGNSSPTDIERWWCDNVLIEGNIMEESRIQFKTHGVGARIIGNTTGYGIIFLGEEVIISDNTITDGARKRFENIIWTQGASGSITGNIIKHTQINNGFAIRTSGGGGSMIVKDNTIISPSKTGLLEKTSNATAYFDNNIWKKDDNTESEILDPIGISTALKMLSIPAASEKWRGQMILVKENTGVFPVIEFNVYAGTNIAAGEFRHLNVVLDGKVYNWQVDSTMNTPELLAAALMTKKATGWHWEATDVPKIVNLVGDTPFKTLGVTTQGMGGSGANIGRKTLVSGSEPSAEKVLICKKNGADYEWLELQPVEKQANLKNGLPLKIWHGTQVEYDAIVEKDATVAYIING